MSAQPKPFLTPEEYLAYDRASPVRNEYWNGEMWAMAGGTLRHSVIITNLTVHLYLELQGSECFPLSSDSRVQVSPQGLYTYPDVSVVCGQEALDEPGSDILSNPIVICEVQSPSTEAYDRGFKFEQYRKIEALQEYAIVSQSEPRVQIFRRAPSTWQFAEFTGLEAICRFESLNIKIPMSQIYSRIDFVPIHPGTPASVV